MAAVKPISIVDSTFYLSLKTLQQGDYGKKPFVEVLSGLKDENLLNILQEERTFAYFNVKGAPGYGINIDSATGSLDGLGPARFNLRYTSRHPISSKSLWTSSKLEDIFSEAQTRNLNMEEVSEALEEGGLFPDVWGKHHKTFYVPVEKIITLKDTELNVPGTLVVELRETPRYAHDRFCTEYNLEISAKLTPELPKSEPVKRPTIGALAGTSLGASAAYGKGRNP